MRTLLLMKVRKLKLYGLLCFQFIGSESWEMEVEDICQKSEIFLCCYHDLKAQKPDYYSKTEVWNAVLNHQHLQQQCVVDLSAKITTE